MKTNLCLLCILLFIGSSFPALAQDTALTNLPTFYITTDGEAPIDRDNYVEGDLHVAGGSPDSGYYNGRLEIKGRGNSTWTFPKQPYKIKLDIKYNLLGMPATAKAWVLLANYADKSLIRNAVAFEVSKLFGFAFTPSYRMADVVLNGDYIGTYTITDQVEQDEDRVNVEELEADDTELPKISGGYMLETGNQPASDEQHYQTSRGMNFSIKYPDDPDDINGPQRNYIINYLQEFEDVLYAPGYKNPETGYRRFVDMKSMTDGYLLNEICGNGDCFHSNNMYKHRDDSALYTGPMWDYDIAFDNDYRLGDTKYKYMYDWAFGPREDGGYGPRVWFSRITDDEYFYRNVRNRFFEVRKAGVQQRMRYVIDSLSTLLSQSQKLNFKRWPILNKYVWMNRVALGTYEKEVDYLRNYVATHFDWLNGEYIGVADRLPMHIVCDQTDKGLQIRNGVTAAGAGVVQYTLQNKPSQLWKVTNLNNGYYTISNLKSGMVITNNGSTATSLPLTQAPPVADSKAQQWRIINVSNKRYGIINRLSGLSFDNANESTADNNYLMQWENHIYEYKPNQHWLFQRIPVIAAAADTGLITFTLSPNPAIGSSVTARVMLNTDAPVSLRIYDVRGLLMQEITKGKLQKGTHTIVIPVARLQSGSYTVTVQAGVEKVSHLLVK